MCDEWCEMGGGGEVSGVSDEWCVMTGVRWAGVR